MARTFRQIIRDENRTGAELGLVLMEKLRNQIIGEDLVCTDKEILLMARELKGEELAIFSVYETIYSTILNIYNFSRQTTFKFYASYNALITLLDKSLILESVQNEENTPNSVKNAVYKVCSPIKELKTKETYEMMFEAVTFIEASNSYIRMLLQRFNITGLNCMQFSTEDFYILMQKLSDSTKKLISSLKDDRVGEAKAVFMDLGEINRKEFTPETKKISEFKEFLRTEPNKVLKNSFSFIMLLQNKKKEAA